MYIIKEEKEQHQQQKVKQVKKTLLLLQLEGEARTKSELNSIATVR